MATSLGQMLEESCRQWPAHPALLQEETALTYADLDRAVNSLGNRMRDQGLQKGDNIALMLPNGIEFVVSYFAIQKIGAVAVTLNVSSTAYELRHLLGNSEARGLITTAQLAQRLAEIKNDVPLCTFLLLHDEQNPEQSPFRSAMEAGPFTLEMPEIKGADPSVIIYTAGLAGRPVGAVLTQENLLGQSYLLKTICGTTYQDRGLAVIPLFHSFGAVVNMLCVIRVGASVVLMDSFSVDAIFQAIESRKITFIAAVPRLFLGMVMQSEDKAFDLSTLKLCISGGAAMPTEFFPRFEARFGIKIMEGYGLTEASPVSAFTRPAGKHKPGSIGPAVPDVEAKVIDDGGRELPTGSSGELLIRGYNVMQGYYHDAAATAAVIRDGWLYTGDLARIDEDGYIFLTGLKKRMIITSGFNVYPREVEIVLNMHPAVQASLALGKPNLLRGEVVKALIVRNPDINVDGKELVRHCRQYLTSYKVPRDIEFVESLA